VSARPENRDRPIESIAGYLAAAAIFVSVIGIVYRPARLIPVAVVLALVAAGVGGRSARLAGFALAVGGLCFILGMTVAVLTGHPLY
jgi:hypothetical protein